MRTIAFLVALVVVIEPAAAQGPDVNALRQRTERLRALTRAAERVESEARRREAQVPKDTILAGPLRVIVERSRAHQVREGAEQAGETIQSLLGDDAYLLEGRYLQLAFGIGTSSGAGQIPVVGLPGNPSADDVRRTIMGWVGPLLASRASAELRAWTGIPIEVDSVRIFRAAHVDLVTALPGAASRCLAGALTDCGIALGLEAPTSPPHAYWDEHARREAVRRLAPSWTQGSLEQVSVACLDGDDPSCIAYLDARFAANAGLVRQLAPLGTASRQTVLLVAMRLGGSGALGRLVSDPSANPRRAIEAAAGQPIEQVLATWHGTVTAANPERRTTPGARLATLFWSLIFGAMALGGTRWRVG